MHILKKSHSSGYSDEMETHTVSTVSFSPSIANSVVLIFVYLCLDAHVERFVSKTHRPGMPNKRGAVESLSPQPAAHERPSPPLRSLG